MLFFVSLVISIVLSLLGYYVTGAYKDWVLGIYFLICAPILIPIVGTFGYLPLSTGRGQAGRVFLGLFSGVACSIALLMGS